MSPRATPLRISAPLGHALGATLELDGADISMQVTGVTVDLEVGEVNRAEIRYNCVSVELDGEFRIVHKCGIETEDDE